MVCLGPIVMLVGVCAMGVAGYFLPGPELRVLQRSVEKAGIEDCEKKFGLRVGAFTLGAGRAVASLADLPGEARCALRSVKAVEFGVYEITKEPAPDACGTILMRADQELAKAGWERTVLVRERKECVAVYTSPTGPTSMRVCVLVLDRREMVLVSAKADLEPLVELAQSKLGDKPLFTGFARLSSAGL